MTPVGPITIYQERGTLLISGTKATLFSADAKRQHVHLETADASSLILDDPAYSRGKNEWYVDRFSPSLYTLMTDGFLRYLARLNTFQADGSSDGTWSYAVSHKC